jgi:ribonucleoside-diphosphate reductase beta chain
MPKMPGKLPEKMPLTPIFNPKGDDRVENRTVWFGNTTNLMQLNDVRYSWAITLYQQMRENFWCDSFSSKP